MTTATDNLSKFSGQADGFAEAIKRLDQFVKMDLPLRDSYLSPWLKEGSINLISGWRGTGKTFLAVSILDAVSRGIKFGPWKCEKQASTLFLDGEMAAQDIIERSNYLNLGVEGQPFYVYSDAYANQLGFPRANLVDDRWRQQMKDFLLNTGIKLWVVDNLASLASGLDENAKQEWDPINQWLLELRFAGVSTIMMHHTNKNGGQRGTSAREDNIDTSILLKRPGDYSPDEGCRFILSFSKARVGGADLNLISDLEFKLSPDDRGQYVWTHGDAKGTKEFEVLRLLDEGLKQKVISEALGVGKGQVSKIRTKAINAGLMTEQNKLTKVGYDRISGS